MSEPSIKRASLAAIKEMHSRGELFHDGDAPVEDVTQPGFWKDAALVPPKKPRSVHLKIDPDVFDFFYAEAQGKGHLTRMQTVLKAYVTARKRA